MNFDIIIEIYQKYNAENLIQNKLQPMIENIMNETPLGQLGNGNKQKSFINEYTINLTKEVNKKIGLKLLVEKMK